MHYGYLLQFCLSIAILSSPAAPPPKLFKLVRHPLVFICLNCEIMDPREVRYVLADPVEFVGDIQMLKARARSLVDCPGVAVSVLFPDKEIVNELLLLNRAHRQYLEMCLNVHRRSQFFRQSIEENEYLYRIWDKARDSRCEFYYVHIRRQALGVLMQELGPEDFWKGKLPPHVPDWKFTSVIQRKTE